MASKRPSPVKHQRGAVQANRSKRKKAIVRPEDLTLEERVALAGKMEAARQRGRPPSI